MAVLTGPINCSPTLSFLRRLRCADIRQVQVADTFPVSIGLDPMGPTTFELPGLLSNYIDPSLHSSSVPAHAGTDDECREETRMILRLAADQLWSRPGQARQARQKSGAKFRKVSLV